MSKRFDPESEAIINFLNLNKIIEQALKGSGQEKCTPLYRRASEAPQLLSQAGLMGLILFYMSKADKDLYESLYKAITSSSSESSSQREGLLGRIADECKGEGKGYTLALALIAKAVASIPTGVSECSSLGAFANIAKCILALREARRELSATALLQPYLISLKRLAEAFHKEREVSE